VIIWQDNVVDKHGAGIGGAMLGTAYSAGRVFTANKTYRGPDQSLESNFWPTIT
jgi:hypothetical protein